MLRTSLRSFALLVVLLAPAVCAAQDGDHPSSSMDSVSMFSYALRGFWSGAEVGLATGYLTTGSHFDHGEWRNLVLGAGIGAITGVGAGIALALVDVRQNGPGTGYFVLRDIGVAAMLGALVGAAVGALVLVGSSHPHARDVLVGLSVGTLVGAGVGAIFGVVEGASQRKRRDGEHAVERASIEPAIVAVPTMGVLPAFGSGVRGTF